MAIPPQVIMAAAQMLKNRKSNKQRLDEALAPSNEAMSNDIMPFIGFGADAGYAYNLQSENPNMTTGVATGSIGMAAKGFQNSGMKGLLKGGVMGAITGAISTGFAKEQQHERDRDLYLNKMYSSVVGEDHHLNSLMYAKDGGEMVSGDGDIFVPIQAEAKKIGKKLVREKLIFSDGKISDVNADKPHSEQKKDAVTDVVSEGTYVMPVSTKISKKDLDSLIDYSVGSYSENKKNFAIKEVRLKDILGEKFEGSFAEATDIVTKKYPVIDTDDDLDPIARKTNSENIANRSKVIAHLMRLNEAKINKQPIEEVKILPTMKAKKGGYIKSYKKGSIVRPKGSSLYTQKTEKRLTPVEDDGFAYPGGEYPTVDIIATRLKKKEYTSFNIPGDKTWEYAQDEDGSYKTRKIGATDWIDIGTADNLSPENKQKAIDKLDNVKGNIYDTVLPPNPSIEVNSLLEKGNVYVNDINDIIVKGNDEAYYILKQDGTLEKADEQSVEQAKKKGPLGTAKISNNKTNKGVTTKTPLSMKKGGYIKRYVLGGTVDPPKGKVIQDIDGTDLIQGDDGNYYMQGPNGEWGLYNDYAIPDMTHIMPGQEMPKGQMNNPDIFTPGGQMEDDSIDADTDSPNTGSGDNDMSSEFRRIIDERMQDADNFRTDQKDKYGKSKKKLGLRDLVQLGNTMAGIGMQNRKTEREFIRPNYMAQKYRGMSNQEIKARSEEATGAGVEMVKGMLDQGGDKLSARLAPLLMDKLVGQQGKIQKAYVDDNIGLERSMYGEMDKVINQNLVTEARAQNVDIDNTNKSIAALTGNVNKYISSRNTADQEEFRFDRQLDIDYLNKKYSLENDGLNVKMTDENYKTEMDEIERRRLDIEEAIKEARVNGDEEQLRQLEIHKKRTEADKKTLDEYFSKNKALEFLYRNK